MRRFIVILLCIILSTSVCFADGNTTMPGTLEPVTVLCYSNMDTNRTMVDLYLDDTNSTAWISVRDVAKMTGWQYEIGSYTVTFKKGKKQVEFERMTNGTDSYVRIDKAFEGMETNVSLDGNALSVLARKYNEEDLENICDEIFLDTRYSLKNIGSGSEADLAVLGGFFYDFGQNPFKTVIGRLTGSFGRNLYMTAFMDILCNIEGSQAAETAASLVTGSQKEMQSANTILKNMKLSGYSIDFASFEAKMLSWMLAANDGVEISKVGEVVKQYSGYADNTLNVASGILDAYIYLFKGFSISDIGMRSISLAFSDNSAIYRLEDDTAQTVVEDLLKLYKGSTLSVSVENMVKSQATQLTESAAELVINPSGLISLASGFNTLITEPLLNLGFKTGDKKDLAEECVVLYKIQETCNTLYYIYKSDIGYAMNAKYATILYLKCCDAFYTKLGMIYSDCVNANDMLADPYTRLLSIPDGDLCWETELYTIANADLRTAAERYGNADATNQVTADTDLSVYLDDSADVLLTSLQNAVYDESNHSISARTKGRVDATVEDGNVRIIQLRSNEDGICEYSLEGISFPMRETQVVSTLQANGFVITEDNRPDSTAVYSEITAIKPAATKKPMYSVVAESGNRRIRLAFDGMDYLAVVTETVITPTVQRTELCTYLHQSADVIAEAFSGSAEMSDGYIVIPDSSNTAVTVYYDYESREITGLYLEGDANSCPYSLYGLYLGGQPTAPDDDEYYLVDAEAENGYEYYANINGTDSIMVYYDNGIICAVYYEHQVWSEPDPTEQPVSVDNTGDYLGIWVAGLYYDAGVNDYTIDISYADSGEVDFTFDMYRINSAENVVATGSDGYYYFYYDDGYGSYLSGDIILDGETVGLFIESASESWYLDDMIGGELLFERGSAVYSGSSDSDDYDRGTPTADSYAQSHANDPDDWWEDWYVAYCDEWISLRTSPDSNSERLTKIYYGDSIQIQYYTDTWYLCKYNGYVGYVLTEYIEYEGYYGDDYVDYNDDYVESDDDSDVYDDDAWEVYWDWMYVAYCDEYISLRESPDSSSACLTKIYYGEEIQCQYYNDTWYYCSYGDYAGYVLAQYLEYSDY